MYICMYLYIYIYIYMYIHTYIHTYIHAYIHTYIHTYMHAYIHTYIHTYTYMYAYIYIYICIYVYVCITVHIAAGSLAVRNSYHFDWQFSQGGRLVGAASLGAESTAVLQISNSMKAYLTVFPDICPSIEARDWIFRTTQIRRDLQPCSASLSISGLLSPAFTYMYTYM